MVDVRVGWLGVALACATLAGGVANAQVDASRDAEARGLFDAATAAFDDGRFEDAYEYFERSHALSGRPALLFNLASTCERLRRDADAIAFYQRYLDAIPNAENRRFVEGRIAFLREAEARANTPPERPPGETVPDPAIVAAQAEPTSAVAPDPTTTPREEPVARRGRRRALWITAAAIAAGGLAAGLVVALRDPGVESPIRGDVGTGGVVVTLGPRGGAR